MLLVRFTFAFYRVCSSLHVLLIFNNTLSDLPDAELLIVPNLDTGYLGGSDEL